MASLYLAYGSIANFHQGKTLPDMHYKEDPILGFDMSVCVVNGSDFSVDNLRNIVKSVFEDSEKLLGELMMGFPYQEFIQASIFEDSSNSQTNYCWLSDTRNVKLRDGVAKFKEYVKRRPEFFGGKDKKTFQRVKTNLWLRKAIQLLKLIVFLFHVTPGQSGRASENVKTLYRNLSSCLRYILFHNKQMVIQPRFLKPESATQKIKKVLRFPCHRLTRLLVIYLAFIRPIET